MNHMKIYSIIFLIVLFASCGETTTADQDNNGQRQQEIATVNSNEPLIIEIRDLEGRVKNDTTFDRTRALRLFRAYQEYYNAHPRDTVAGNYLFEAANLAQKLDKQQKAIDLFINFHDGFPSSHRCDEAVYNIAYIYDARLGNKKKAAEYYNKVIELYPQSMWAEQARGALKLVNMSNEELLRYLKEKNNQPL